MKTPSREESELKLKQLQLTLEKLNKSLEGKEKGKGLINFWVKDMVTNDKELKGGIKELPINKELLKDSRNLEYFNSQYLKGLTMFKIDNPGESEQYFIKSEVKKLQAIQAEKERKFSLSDDEYYLELSKSVDIIEIKHRYFKENKEATESDFKANVLRSNLRQEQKFEDWRLTLYKQKIDVLPKIEENLKGVQEEYRKIFENNGFVLFEYMFNNCLPETKGQNTGYQTDISYFYRRMFNDGFIHSKITPFSNWLYEYSENKIEPFKIKTLDSCRDKSGKRSKIYKTALDWFKQEKK